MIWPALWGIGVPIAYWLDSDPTGTRWDRLLGAAMWPMVALVIVAMLTAGGAIMAFGLLQRAITAIGVSA